MKRRGYSGSAPKTIPQRPEGPGANVNGFRESMLQEVVVDYAKLTGWLLYHTWNSQHSTKGFPDLVLVRDGRIVFAELKRQGEDPTKDQLVWLARLDENENVDVYVWRPKDWLDGTIERALKR